MAEPRKSLKIATLLIAGGSLASAAAMSYSLNRTEGLVSNFNQVWNAVTVNPQISADETTVDFGETGEGIVHSPSEIKSIVADLHKYGTSESPTLPHYSSKNELLMAIANFSMYKAAQRTVQNHEDYRDYFTKLVHSNGICFSGQWQITENSQYSGLFKMGSSALMIGRISAATPQTTNDANRSFGFAGKLFPTTDPRALVKTANFFTVHNLNGTDAKHALDVAFVNAPPVNFADGAVGKGLKLMNWIFSFADDDPGMRPLYPIARAGLQSDESPVSPKYMRIVPAPGTQSKSANDADFRDELSKKNYPNGLVFLIEVSDTTKDPNATAGWQKIGEIHTSALETTFGCDRRLHFSHPTSKDPGN